MSKKEVCVVGAGSSGLTCARQMLDYGFDVVLYERSADIGGLWAYHDDDVEGRASVMRTTVINTSKEMSAFSDYPMPKDFPNYMHSTNMLGYFRSYADHFGVTKHVKTRHDVVQVTPAADYEKTGRWDVLVRDLEANTDRTDTYDAVAVCVGHHVYPNVPHFKGQEKFRGRIVHTHSLKNADTFRDRRVAVIGIGNSGLDAVVDASYVALEVSMTYSSLIATASTSRSHGLVVERSPRLREIVGSLPTAAGHPLVLKWAHVYPRLAFGNLQLRIFESLAFICLRRATSVCAALSPALSSHLSMFPLTAGLTNICLDCTCAQSRWMAELLCEKRPLPSEEAMLEDIRKKRDSMRRRYVASLRHTIQVDWINYMGEVASQIGARSNILKYFFTDNELFRALLGPCVPYQFRLEGPHPWSGARQAILDSRYRVMYPLNDRCTSFERQ
nr:flavin-containing monooxygenase 5-like [Dermacentor andersoni]